MSVNGKPLLAAQKGSASVKAAAVQRKLVILCLHGYLQNAEMFSAKIGSMRKAMRQKAEFLFIDAPHRVTADESTAQASGGSREGGRAWWLWQDIEEGMRPSLAAQYTGWEESYNILAKAIQEHKPDGILGFSQGATAAALFLACVEEQELETIAVPKFALLVAGFLPRDGAYAERLKADSPDVPVFLVHGESDRLIPETRSRELQEALQRNSHNLEVFMHPGAHMVPSCSGAFKQRLHSFLDARRHSLDRKPDS